MSSPLTVQFLVISPHTDKAAWPANAYPWQDLIESVEAIAVRRRQQTIGKFTAPLTAEVTTHGTQSVLSIHQVDLAARRTEAQAGSITVREFGDDAGPTDASHLMPVEDDIFALARESGGPGPNRVGAYIGVLAGPEFEPNFMPIGRVDGSERLKRMATASSVTLAMATAAVNNYAGQDPFRRAFKAAAAEIDSDEISITYKVKRKAPATAAWFSKNRPKLEDFLGGDRAAILEAKAGSERLLEQAVTHTAYVADTRGAVDPNVVIQTIREQYRAYRDEIQESLGRKP